MGKFITNRQPEYPTHLLIDKNGKIRKVVNSIKELAPFLQKEIEKDSSPVIH